MYILCFLHSEDCFDQAFKLKQEFGLLTEMSRRKGPPLLPNALPTLTRRSSTLSSNSSSNDFFLSAEAQQLGPSGKKPRLASENRAKKKVFLHFCDLAVFLEEWQQEVYCRSSYFS